MYAQNIVVCLSYFNLPLLRLWTQLKLIKLLDLKYGYVANSKINKPCKINSLFPNSWKFPYSKYVPKDKQFLFDIENSITSSIVTQHPTFHPTLVILMLSTSARNGEIPFSPTTFMAVPKASADASRTFGSETSLRRWIYLVKFL